MELYIWIIKPVLHGFTLPKN